LDKNVKNTLIPLGITVLTLLFADKVLAENNPLVITIDQSVSTVTVVDSVGQKTTMPARTALPGRKLDEGLYEVDVGLLPECVKDAKDFCETDKNGLYAPKPDQTISTLSGWNEPNRAVALQAFFKAVKVTKRLGSKVPKIKKGYVLVPAFHSEILKKTPDGNFSTPPETIVQGFATQGCIRMGYTDLRFLYTLILHQWGKGGKIEIYVK
jgi:hypothetical protein